jgi:hypothetical protein
VPYACLRNFLVGSFGSRLCGNAKRTLVSRNLSVIPQNFAPNVLLTAAERSYGVPVTKKVRKQPQRAYAPASLIALIIPSNPKILNTRLKLYASTFKPTSALTLGSRRVRKCV